MAVFSRWVKEAIFFWFVCFKLIVIWFIPLSPRGGSTFFFFSLFNYWAAYFYLLLMIHRCTYRFYTKISNLRGRVGVFCNDEKIVILFGGLLKRTNEWLVSVVYFFQAPIKQFEWRRQSTKKGLSSATKTQKRNEEK